LPKKPCASEGAHKANVPACPLRVFSFLSLSFSDWAKQGCLLATAGYCQAGIGLQGWKRGKVFRINVLGSIQAVPKALGG